MYRCFAPGCAKASKLWPRLDNFKQHLIRMHPSENVEALVKKSIPLQLRIARANGLVDPSSGMPRKKAMAQPRLAIPRRLSSHPFKTLNVLDRLRGL